MKQIFISFLALTAVACGNNPKQQETTNTDTTQQTNNTTTGDSQKQDEKKETALVSFKVNGVEVNTKSSGTDNDPQLGMVNVKINELSFDLMGDDPARPHRGWLHFSIKNFKLEPGTYTATGGNTARFTRYETAGAGGGTDYNAEGSPKYKGSEFTLQVTSIKKNEAAEFGEEWFASGTFTVKGLLNEFSKSDTKEVQITEGKFENISIRVLGRQ